MKNYNIKIIIGASPKFLGTSAQGYQNFHICSVFAEHDLFI